MTEQTETLPEFIDVTEYRHDHGHRAWAWRCSGADVCDGWLSLDHSSEESATRSARKHQEQEHAALQACRASISGRCLAVTQGDPGCATTDGECTHAPAADAALADVREQIAEALMGWAERNNAPQYASMRRPDTVRQNAYSRADAVLRVPAIAEALTAAAEVQQLRADRDEWEATAHRHAKLWRDEQDASRRLLEQRQEMAAERYAWQERGDRAEAAIRRVHESCAKTPPCIPGSQAEDVAHAKGWNDAMDVALAALNPREQPTPRVHVGGNAEDCPACDGTNPPYPFICPGNNQPPTA